MSPENAPPPRPPARPGEVIAPAGRWNDAALRRLQQHAGHELIWTEGTLGVSVSVGGVVVGRLNRHRRGQPWTIRLSGYERWHEPTRLITHWHYTPVWSARTLAAAKREIAAAIHTLPIN